MKANLMFVLAITAKELFRNKSEAFHPDYLKRTVKFAQGLIVWGCMSSKGVENLFIDGMLMPPSTNIFLNITYYPQ